MAEGSVSSSRQQLALFHEASPGRLRVDLAVLGGTLSGGAELFSFALVPAEVPATIAVASSTEFASRTADGFRHESEEFGDSGFGAAPDPTAPNEEALGEELEEGPAEGEEPGDEDAPGGDAPGEDDTGGDSDEQPEDEEPVERPLAEEAPDDEPGNEP